MAADLRPSRSHHASQLSTGISHGCLFAVIATLITCGMLFINGAIVRALCDAAADPWPRVFGDHRVEQFIYFVGPVVLVVIQWMMIDYVISRVRRWP